MARTRTLLEMRTEARELADMVGSEFVTDATLTRMVNQALAELWGKLAQNNPDRYYATDTIVTSTGTHDYALPVDFYRLLGIDEVRGGERFRLEPYGFQERTDYSSSTALIGTRETPRYRLQVNNVHLEPDPGVRTLEVHYVQAPPELAADGDTFDGVAGYEGWIVRDAAIKMLIKEESDPSALMAERAALEAHILSDSPERDTGRAPRVQRVWRNYRRFPRAR